MGHAQHPGKRRGIGPRLPDGGAASLPLDFPTGRGEINRLGRNRFPGVEQGFQVGFAELEKVATGATEFSIRRSGCGPVCCCGRYSAVWANAATAQALSSRPLALRSKAAKSW